MVILCQKMKNQTDRKPKHKKFSSSNQDIKLFPTRLIRNDVLRDEVGEAIDNELKLISNDSKYLQKSVNEQLEMISQAIATSCSNLLKPPKRKPFIWFQESTHLNEMIDTRRKYYREYMETRNQRHKQNHKTIQKGNQRVFAKHGK